MILHDALKRHFGFSSFRPMQEEIVRDVLAGVRGPARDAAVVNAAAALYASGRAADLREGARQAERAIDSGAAAATLERLVAVSRGARADADSAA